MLYNVALVSAIQQHDSAIVMHMSFLLESPSHAIPPLEVVTEHQVEIPGSYASSHWLSILHKVMHISQYYSFNSSNPLFPPLCPQVCFSMSASLLLPYK